MDGVSARPVSLEGDSMWESLCFGAIELEIREGHRWGRPVASGGYCPGDGARGLEGSPTARSCRRPRAPEPPAECGPWGGWPEFSLTKRARHVLCGWLVSPRFTFTRLIPKYGPPPPAFLSVRCLKNSQGGTDRRPPKPKSVKLGGGRVFTPPRDEVAHAVICMLVSVLHGLCGPVWSVGAPGWGKVGAHNGLARFSGSAFFPHCTPSGLRTLSLLF